MSVFFIFTLLGLSATVDIKSMESEELNSCNKEISSGMEDKKVNITSSNSTIKDDIKTDDKILFEKNFNKSSNIYEKNVKEKGRKKYIYEILDYNKIFKRPMAGKLEDMDDWFKLEKTHDKKSLFIERQDNCEITLLDKNFIIEKLNYEKLKDIVKKYKINFENKNGVVAELIQYKMLFKSILMLFQNIMNNYKDEVFYRQKNDIEKYYKELRWRCIKFLNEHGDKINLMLIIIIMMNITKMIFIIIIILTKMMVNF